jgi:ABC-type Fe3+ transport system substrate-binding protein
MQSSLRALAIVGLVSVLACAPTTASPPRPAASAEPDAAPAASAAPDNPALAAVIAGARQEGTLSVIWSSNTLGGRQGSERIVDSLNKRYGLDVKVNWTPGPAMPDMAVRLAQELAAGRPASSDLYVGTESQMRDFVENGGLRSIDWTSLAPYIPPSVVAPQNTGVEIVTRVPGVTYNTSLVPADLVPHTSADLLKPAWKGKLASTPYGTMFDVLGSKELWGPERAISYSREISESAAGLMRCGETERLISGEFWGLVFDCGSYEARTWQARGAPIGNAILRDAAAILYWWIAVPQHSAHPNLATLYVLEAMSPEGQAIVWDEQKSDSWKLPGSRSAEEIRALEKEGAKFVEANVPFTAAYTDQQAVRKQIQDALSRAQ